MATTNPLVGAAGSSWGDASYDSNMVARKHFNIFLRDHYLPAHPELSEMLFGLPLAEADVNYEKIPLAKRKLLDFKVFNEFGEYLPKHAVNQTDKKSKLAYESGSRYFSSMVTRVNNDLRELNNGHDHLAPSGTNKIRQGLRNLFVRDAIQSHKPLSNSHKDASRNDLISIILLCLWTVDIKLAQFAFFLGSLYQLSGRVAEASVVPFKNVKMYQPDEFRGLSPTETDKIAQVFLWRTKTVSNQDLSIFNDRDSFIIDWYFLMAYSMIMSEEKSEQLFPDFASKGQKNLDTDGNIDGNDAGSESNAEENPNSQGQAGRQTQRRRKKARESVSRYFTETFNKVIKMYDVLRSQVESGRYQEEERPRGVPSSFVEDSYIVLNRDVTSHTPKRTAVNTALEDPILSTILICLRAGWIMKAVHTVFDYVSYNKNHDRKVARSLSMWRVCGPDDGHSGAGRPPSIKALKSQTGDEYEKGELVMKCLFIDYESIEGANNRDLQDILFATVLKNLESYLALLKEHPERIYGETDQDCFKNHRFLQKLVQSATNAGIECPVETLLAWGRLIDIDFHRRNFMFVSQESLRRVLPPDEVGNTFSVDARSFFDYFDQSSRAMEQLHREIILVRRQNNEMKKQRDEEIQLRKEELELKRKQVENQVILIQQNQEIIHFLRQLSGTQGLTLNLPDLSHDNQMAPNANTMVPPQDEPVQAVTLPGLSGLKVTTIFLSWHRYEYYKLPVRDSAKKDRNTRFVIKMAIEYFSLFLDTHIDALPDNVNPGVPSRERTQWIRQLEEKTKTAWKKVEDLQDDIVSQTKEKKSNLNLVTAFKKFMDKLDHAQWPVGPPGVSNFQPKHMGKMKTRAELAQQQVNRRSKRRNSEEEDAEEGGAGEEEDAEEGGGVEE